MNAPGVSLPCGFSLSRFDRLDSTNAEALRRAATGAPDSHWVWARAQTAGRGRAGRSWDSPEGNLFASLLLRPACPPKTMPQLAFVAGLAVHDAVAALAGPEVAGGLTLKWPNDLLLQERKLAGILLETGAPGRDGANAAVLGTGLNIARHPGNAPYPATDLAAHGVTITAAQAFEALARASASWLEAWDAGRGFERVRAAWASHALPVGTPIRVNAAGGTRQGAYGGLADDGALVLRHPDGAQEHIRAGDVFPIHPDHRDAPETGGDGEKGH